MKPRDVDETCILKTNPNCWPLNELEYNASCCTPDEPCGILQGGCISNNDCMDNLECSVDHCGLDSDKRCCQPPGRKPGILFAFLIFLDSQNFSVK